MRLGEETGKAAGGGRHDSLLCHKTRFMSQEQRKALENESFPAISGVLGTSVVEYFHLLPYNVRLRDRFSANAREWSLKLD